MTTPHPYNSYLILPNSQRTRIMAGTHHRESYLIQTSCWAKPIPDRNYDWSAVLDGYDGGDWETSPDPAGWGRTEEAAIQDLLEQIRSEEEL
jgi:hypothetical protein